MGVDLNPFSPRPDGEEPLPHGGYCGPAVKPIALLLGLRFFFVFPSAELAALLIGMTLPNTLFFGATTVPVCASRDRLLHRMSRT